MEPATTQLTAAYDLTRQKERARDVFSSTMNAQPIAPSSNSPTRPPSTHDSINRKRSDSASRRPHSTRTQGARPDSRPTYEELALRQYIHKDQMASQAIIRDEDDKKTFIDDMVDETEWWQKMRKSNRYDPGYVYGDGYQGYGNGWTAQDASRERLPKLTYPAANKRSKLRRAATLRYNHKVRDAQKDRDEHLVPIRLDLEIDKLRLRDTFTWDLNDRVVRVKDFAEGLVEDFQVPAEQHMTFLKEVEFSIKEQIQDFHPHLFIEEDPLDPHLPYLAYKNDDLRIIIKLNITIGSHSLVDQFEWDINNPTNSPEDFARKMAADLCLSGEFMTAIAHSIHEQTQTFTKSLFITGHPFDGRPVEDMELRDNMQPSPLTTAFRPYQAAREFAPFFYELSEADLERTEDAFLREQRQQKRSTNRKGGPTLPELKERLRTVRTMVVSSVVPGAADAVEDSGLHRPTRRTGRGKKSYRVDEEGSEFSTGEEESGPDEQALQGPSRARRGAASAAQAAMRAAQPGSLTPEFQQPRPKRFGISYEPNPQTGADGMILKLKVPRNRLRELVRELKRESAVRREYDMPQQPAAHRSEISRRPPDQAMPPPHARQQTPAHGTPSRTSSANAMARAAHADGANETPPSRAAQISSEVSMPPRPPPPPVWLTQAVDKLMRNSPGESYSAAMRWSTKDNEYQPRIKCLDCANNIMYKTDEAEPIKNFLVHVSNQDHQRKVKQKLQGYVSDG